MSIKLNLEGFEEFIKAVEKAGGSAERVILSHIHKEADIMQEELISQMKRSNVDEKLINEMPPPMIENDYERVTARVGYPKREEYNKHDIADVYKLVFLNYGTPYRRTHGKENVIQKRGFIRRAKNRAKRKIKADQEAALNEILKGLK